MSGKRSISLALTFIATLCAMSCRNAAGEHYAPAEDSVPAAVYDTSIYCFNGTSIVMSGGKWGIIDTSGTVILPVVYDHVAYITDDIAEAGEGDIHYLADIHGNILAEARSSGNLDEDALAAWAETVTTRLEKSWDHILDMYEELAQLCSDKDADEKSVQAKADEIKLALDEIQGSMSKSQRARFDMIRSSSRDFS